MIGRGEISDKASLREAGSQLPSRDCDRRIDDLVGIMNQKTKPSRPGPPE